jgi:2-polyprenyl-3-methyl-5-hydroxy-6-metoxy-1,4-benzoquinol methylase
MDTERAPQQLSSDSYPSKYLVRCHVCGSDRARKMFKAPLDKFAKAMGRTTGVEYHYCDHCAVLFQFPIFDSLEYQQFYENIQRSDETGYKSGEVPKKHLDKKQRDTAFKWTQMKLMDLERVLPGNRVFEIGPAEGTLLASFRDRGYIVRGIEPLAPYARYARDVLKLDVIEGYFDAAVAAREKADLVIFDGVLEHLTTPFETLKLVRRMICADGIVYLGGLPSAEVATPTSANIAHITLWSRRSLALVLRCAGFQPLCIIVGRPTNRPDEWVCIAQACLEPHDIEDETPILYPAPDFDELSAHWHDMLGRYARAAERDKKYGAAYTVLRRSMCRMRTLARKFV